MAAGQVQVRDRLVIEAMNRLRDNAADMRSANQQIGRALKTRIQFQYRSGQDPYGNAWAPTQDRSGTPLRDKGNLRNAWDFVADDDSVALTNNRSVSYKGASFSLAAIHHFGAVIEPRDDGPGFLRFTNRMGETIIAKQVTIPARRQIPNAGWPQNWLNDVLRITEQHIRD